MGQDLGGQDTGGQGTAGQKATGQVIPFRRGARRRASSAPPSGDAQILFFLGVRYCRDEDDSGKHKKSRRAPATRSRRKKQA